MDNRIDPTAAPAPSPTGTPVIPVAVVPWLTAAVGACGIALTLLPAHTIAFHVCSVVVTIGTMFGIASPGWRK